MHTVDGDVPLGDASPLSNQDAHVQEQRVHGSDPSVADRISFASAVTAWTAESTLVYLRDLVCLTEPANEMMLPNLTASAMETTPSTTAPGPHDRRAVLVRIPSRPWMDKVGDDYVLYFHLRRRRLLLG